LANSLLIFLDNWNEWLIDFQEVPFEITYDNSNLEQYYDLRVKDMR
jgi:hypothetical protein